MLEASDRCHNLLELHFCLPEKKIFCGSKMALDISLKPFLSGGERTLG